MSTKLRGIEGFGEGIKEAKNFQILKVGNYVTQALGMIYQSVLYINLVEFCFNEQRSSSKYFYTEQQ